MLYDEKKTWKVGTKDMKPRIFVSSTFYDLKYVREDLANFIRAYEFEPIMFEEGDIGYTPGKPLDASCYDAMRTADMVILIIGSTYGSPATDEKSDVFDEYLSITRKEFQTAVEAGIPIYAFVESSVYVEYGVYEANMKNIESKSVEIVFKSSKNINVFRFIKEVYSVGKIVVTDFKKPSEIKDYMSKQWADMFKKYLQSLRETKSSERLYEAMDSMKTLIKQMGVMVDGLGKKVIGNENDIAYEQLINRQLEIRAAKIARNMCDMFSFKTKNADEREKNINAVLKVIKESLLAIKMNVNELDMTDSDKIIDIIDPIFSELAKKEEIEFTLDLRFYREWEESIELVENQKLSGEVQRLLADDKYYYKLYDSSENDEK